MKTKIRISSCSTKGIRSVNQDYVGYKVKKNVSIGIVCDGIGSLEKSQYASKTIVKYFLKSIKNIIYYSNCEQWFEETLKFAYNQMLTVWQFKNLKENIGTTLAMVVIYNGYYYAFNIGDSRVYNIGLEKMMQISVDQNYLYFLQKNGKNPQDIIAQKDRWYHLVNFIDTNGFASAQYEHYKQKIDDHATFLICSDGLYNFISESDLIKAINGTKNLNFLSRCLNLIAKKNKSNDNISNVIIRYN